jgi:RNA polymerase sigma factor (sigma-70 family)
MTDIKDNKSKKEKLEKAELLTIRVKDGDDFALKELMSMYDKLIERAFRKRLRKGSFHKWLRLHDHDLADDMKVEVWMKFVQAVRNGNYSLQTKDPRNFLWYITTINTVNWMRPSLRKRLWIAPKSWEDGKISKRRNYSFIADRVTDIEALNPGDEIFEGHYLAELLAKTESLPESDRNVILAITKGKESGLRKEMIAEQLGISPKSLYNHVKRIKQQILNEDT